MHLGPPLRGRRGEQLARLRARLRDERGFTLIELLVATIAGTIVSAAMAAIVIVSVHFASNTQDRVDANQQGRVAMERIVQALNSSCVAADVAPIQAGSDSSHLIFYSGVGQGGYVIQPNELEVETQANGSGNSLVMATYQYSSGSGASGDPWVFSSTANPVATLLSYVAQATLNGSSTPVPYFQYYGYDSSGNLDTNLDPSGGTLSASTAAQVAEVVVSFQALPSDNWSAVGRAANITDSVVLRLTPASSNSSVTNGPCQ